MHDDAGTDTAYRPSDSILVIGICSRTKDTTPGNPVYPTDSGIARFISEGKKEFLHLKRNELKHNLNDILWGKTKFVSELAMNRNLVEGPDFAGEEIGKYLPALRRYQGKFYYQGLGGTEVAFETVYGSGHHFLILSGLYGLVTPDEPIQLYTCPVEIESVEVQTFWRKIDTLTRILLDYIQQNNIKRIFDLSGRQIYRDLINWDYVQKKCGVTVLHCHCEDAAGDPALGDLGRVAREYLFKQSEKNLLALSPETPVRFDWGECTFSESADPPRYYAHESPPGMPFGDSSEEDIQKIRDYINYRLDEFEKHLVKYLKEKQEQHRDLIYSLDIDRRKAAEIRKKAYLKEFPMEDSLDLTLIDYLEYGDYRQIINARWTVFRQDFGKQDRFNERFEQIRKLRNNIKHNNPVPLSDLKEGEAHLLFFASAFDRYWKVNRHPR
ncbi:hypothetical protein Metli_1291 [Methanofollis liminatans DSM 4140]|uniref:Swt1-like HEPN domain-containing protein n=2 Tax=Methanofollis liminatans TaxID=2201 RepID=J1L2F9_9EURY|nr:hypothetical protein Metli_1291 [Methanofollis liminatans DSM 4140]